MGKSSVKKAARAKSAKASVKKSAKLVSSPAKRPGKSSVSRSASRARGRDIVLTASPPMQPMSIHSVLPQHRYQVGEIVYYTSPSFGRAAATGSYKVVKQLPSEGDDYQYRIKSSDEAFERVAKESQLDRA